jgi:hypothetical protein
MKNKRKSRKQLKLDYIGIKNKIRNATSIENSLFYSPDYLTGKNQWIDFYFLSKKIRTLWNAEIVTTKLAFKDLIYTAAMNEIEKILGQDWLEKYHFHEEIKNPNGTVTWKPLPENKLDKLGGMTCFEWIKQKEKELADSGKFFVSESAEIEFNYQFGIGLHIVKHEENITGNVINGFIEEFIAKGEHPYCLDKHITFNSKDIDWYSVDVNALK